jgi:hypothetical protein
VNATISAASRRFAVRLSMAGEHRGHQAALDGGHELGEPNPVYRDRALSAWVGTDGRVRRSGQ